MQLNILIKDAHDNAVKKGFFEAEDSVINKMLINNEFSIQEIKAVKNAFKSQNLMLLVGEVAEANEALRKNDEENFKEELADIAIRLAGQCGNLGLDLDTEIRKKMDKNINRPYMHGKTF